jgi:hypothetical protein
MVRVWEVSNNQKIILTIKWSCKSSTIQSDTEHTSIELSAPTIKTNTNYTE